MAIDPNIQAFINYQNNVFPSGSGWPAAWNFTYVANGSPANPGTNEVTGFGAGTSTLDSGGFNVILMGGAHTATTPAYRMNVDGTGLTTITDTASNQTMSVSGAGVLLFQGGAAASAGVYSDMMVIAHNAAEATIACLYQSTFNRLPDIPGLEYWWNQYDHAGQSLAQIAQQFITSAEFQSRYGANITDATFVNELYSNVLGRAPDQAGLTYWNGQLTSLEQSGQTVLSARAQVLVGFATSQEEANNSAHWLVNTALGGYADAGETLSAQSVLNQGVTNNYINTAIMTIPTATTASSNYSVDALGNPASGVELFIGWNVVALWSAQSGSTNILSATVPSGNATGDNQVWYLTASGQSIGVAGNNDVIYLSAHSDTTQTYSISEGGGGTSASARTSNPTGLAILGFAAGQDTFRPTLIGADRGYAPGQASSDHVTILDAGQGHINGASLNFATNYYVIKLGNVGDGSAASVAAAINAAYTTGGQTGYIPTPPTGSTPNILQTVPGENITFIGQVTQAGSYSAGDTVVYSFANWQSDSVTFHPTTSTTVTVTFYVPVGSPVAHAGDAVTASELTFSARLVGVTEANLTAHDFGG